jgi:Tol biopolymer transport system component
MTIATCVAAALGALGPSAACVAAAQPALIYDRDSGGNRDVYLLPLDGGAERRLTRHPAPDHGARWTRDGSSILFESERTGSWQIWEVAPTGGEARRVRVSQAREWQMDESPDRTRVAFLSNQKGRECLWLLQRAGGGARDLLCHGRNSVLGNPHWSPDAKQIVFSSNWRIGHQIYAYDVVAGTERRISPVTAGGCEPRFSPDGTKVIYVTRRHWKTASRIIENDLATGEERVLVAGPGLSYDPVYSPDGKEIAFVSNQTGDWVLYRLNLATGRFQRVPTGSGSVRNPDYRPFPRPARRP